MTNNSYAFKLAILSLTLALPVTTFSQSGDLKESTEERNIRLRLKKVDDKIDILKQYRFLDK